MSFSVLYSLLIILCVLMYALSVGFMVWGLINFLKGYASGNWYVKKEGINQISSGLLMWTIAMILDIWFI